MDFLSHAQSQAASKCSNKMLATKEPARLISASIFLKQNLYYNQKKWYTYLIYFKNQASSRSIADQEQWRKTRWDNFKDVWIKTRIQPVWKVIYKKLSQFT